MIDPVVAGIIGTLITALASVSIAVIQSRSSKSQPGDKPGVIWPPGARPSSVQRQRRIILWIVAFSFAGGIIGFIIGVAAGNTTGVSTSQPSRTVPSIVSVDTQTPTSLITTQAPVNTQTVSSPTIKPAATQPLPPTTAVNSTPTGTTVTPIPPPAGLGALTVKALEGCSASFSIQSNQQVVGGGTVGERKLVAVGTYDIQLLTQARFPSIRKSVTIQEGEDNIVDFTEDVGLLVLTRYPNFDLQIVYHVLQEGNLAGINFRTDGQYCLAPGKYKIDFSPSRLALTFDVEVKAKATTTVESASWPQQLGVLSFTSSNNVVPTFNAYDQETGALVAIGAYRSSRTLLVVGTYKIVVTDPYVGLTYEGVEIKAERETILQLPASP